MDKKIYVEGNMFRVVDVATGNIEGQDHSKDVKIFQEKESGSTRYQIWSPRINDLTIAFANIKDKAGDAYADVATWETFYTTSTGGFEQAGASPAYAEYHLPVIASPIPLALNDDGVTYTKIPLMVAGLVKGYSVAGGTLTKIDGNVIARIVGVSDVQVNKATMLFYALFVNDSEVPSEVTPHTFTNQSKIENISITAIAQINETDTIDIRARTDGSATGVTITVAKLDVTFGKEDDA